MPDYPDDWQERRETVFRRDGYRCRRCGARGHQIGGRATLHAHHRSGRDDDVSNLITLCGDCHADVDGNDELRDRRTSRAKRGPRSTRSVGDSRSRRRRSRRR
jgi:5-methylcytosine-specific restriction endonuclease McrA